VYELTKTTATKHQAATTSLVDKLNVMTSLAG
jgi:hypothetical protein